MIRRFIVFILFLSIGSIEAISQCAMCRTQLENNVSNGDVGIAAGINTGILYLLSLPYLAILLLGYIWYRNSKRDVAKFDQGAITR
ncbi:MAG: hypothetical protein KF687_14055 [Cyclobacteriaceae bacterium]|nr:hypothetical protein [Cyclobacteriaceae bacterium]